MRTAEVTSAVRRRIIAPRADAPERLELTLELDRALTREEREALDLEVWHARGAQLPGAIPILGAVVAHARVTLELGPIPANVVRLDAFFTKLAERGSPLGSAASAYLVDRLATIVGALHRAPAPGGATRVHGALTRQAIFVGSEGQVLLLGQGLPLVDALVVPVPESKLERFRTLAPEVAAGERPDGRSDVYSLAVLYYELLAGRPYRATLPVDEIYLKAIEGHPPDVPGQLPDPRPALLDILRAALDASPTRRFSVVESFGTAVKAEASPGDGARALLGRLVDEFARDVLPRGAAAVVMTPPPSPFTLHGHTIVASVRPIGQPRLGAVIHATVTTDDGAADAILARAALPAPERGEQRNVAPEAERAPSTSSVVGADVSKPRGPSITAEPPRPPAPIDPAWAAVLGDAAGEDGGGAVPLATGDLAVSKDVPASPKLVLPKPGATSASGP
ncbi:hypothetical protein L6R52_20505, partial [Myxococcota bacterium]|nr:hypothetical protein [Myxococcota bacterium]